MKTFRLTFRLMFIGFLVFFGALGSVRAEVPVSEPDRALFLILGAITQNLGEISEAKFTTYTKEKDNQARWIAMHFDALGVLVDATQRYLWIMKKSTLAEALEKYRRQLVLTLAAAPHKGSLRYLETHFGSSLRRAAKHLENIEPLLAREPVNNANRFHRSFVFDLRVLLQTLNVHSYGLTLAGEDASLATPTIAFTFKADPTIMGVAQTPASQMNSIRLRLNYIRTLFTKLIAIANSDEPSRADPSLIRLFQTVNELNNNHLLESPNVSHQSDEQTLAQLTELEGRVTMAIRIFTYACPRLFSAPEPSAWPQIETPPRGGVE